VATRAAANVVKPGTAVDYRGSLTQFHGPARFEDVCDCYYGDPRDDCWGYALVLPDGRRLLHVKPGSFDAAATIEPIGA
jgi:hypothetical protein